MKTLISLWNNFKSQPDAWFFYGFLVTFTLSIRKIIKFYPLAGQFNEYAGIYLYLSDIFLILTLASWGITILERKCLNLSSFASFYSLNKAFLKFLLFFNLWVITSISWSDQPAIALFRAVKIFEFSLFFLYITLRIVSRGTLPETNHNKSPDNGTFLKNILQFLIGTAIFHSTIGVWQFFTQKSIGLLWLRESLISPDLPGVAKIIFGGEKYIRAYGLFPHPNILGGFLVFSLLITWAYYKMFHPSTNVPRGTFYGAGVEHSTRQALNAVFHKLYPVIIGLQLLALFLTFSKSAIIGLIIAILYILLKIRQAGNTSPQSKCSTPVQMFHVEHSTGQAWNICTGVEHYWKEICIFILIMIIGFNNLNLDWSTFLLKSLDERETYINVSRETISGNFLYGVGIGQFVLEINNNVPPARNAEQECSTWNIDCKQNITEEKYSAKIVAGGRRTLLEPWQYQPVHNVFLLILSELGLIGLILFCTFLYYVFRCPDQTCQKSENGEVGKGRQYSVLCTLLKGFLPALLFIAFFDHYLWDIQQGQIILWLVLGILANIFAFSKKPGSY